MVSLSTKKIHGDCMWYVSCMLCFLILSTKGDLLKSQLRCNSTLSKGGQLYKVILT